MATPSNPSSQEAVVRRKNNGPPFKFLVPLVYAPVLPLIRISLRHRPVLRDRLFYTVLAGAFAHGLYIMGMPKLERYTKKMLVLYVKTDQYDIERK